MNRAPGLVAALSLLATLAACGSGGDPQPPPPPPPPPPVNLLLGYGAGGPATVAAITAYDSDGYEDTEGVWGNDLSEDCSLSYEPHGTLCDEPPTTDSLLASTKSVDSGATWYATDLYGGLETGVLIVDACWDGSCTWIAFSEAYVFQMFADGKVTDVRLSVHTETGDTPPAWNDVGWEFLGDGSFTFVGAGATADGGVTAIDPTVLDLGPHSTRYLRIEVQNQGDHVGPDDTGEYIELRSLKLF